MRVTLRFLGWLGQRLAKVDRELEIPVDDVGMISTILDSNPDLPYMITVETRIGRAFNPAYGDDRICECGHPYYRHFDTYEDMLPVGCKYCECGTFKETH